MSNKRKKKDNAILDKVLKETGKEIFRWKDDIQILMPFQVAIMRSDMTKIHQNTVLLILEKIKKQLSIALNGRKDQKRELTLFPEQEFGTDPREIKMQLYYKDFGVPASNYNYLEQMLSAIPRIPVQIPTKSNSGREYRMFTNFCNVYLPKKQVPYNKYVIISMQREVADALMNFDLGYLYVGKNTSIMLETKYSERMYWYIKGNLSNHGATISISEFRQMFGLTDKYKNFNALEKNVLATSQTEIKDKYDRDEIECYFSYEKLYNHGPKRGEPDAIKFTIYGNNNSLEDKFNKIIKNQKSIVRSMLKDDLGLSDTLVALIVKRVTKDNSEALQNEIVKIKVALDTKSEDNDVVKNKTAYIVSSLNNFFTNFDKRGGGEVPDTAASKDTNVSIDYRQGWSKVVQEMYQYIPQKDADAMLKNTKFDSYNPKTGELSIIVDRPAYDMMKVYTQKLMQSIRKNIARSFKRLMPRLA